MKITIDLDHINRLIQGSKGIVLDHDSEKSILELLKLQETIENAIKVAKTKIKETALELDPNFKAIHSDNLKIAYRAYG